MSSQRPITRSGPYGSKNNPAKVGLKVHTTAVPLAKNYVIQPQPTRATDIGRNETLIEGHEIFAEAIGHDTFLSKGFSFNPGLALYERLSKLALAYEKYRVRKLEVVYVPTRAVTITPGAIYLTAEYDPSETPPSSMNALSSYESTASGRAFEMVRLNIPQKRMFDDVKAKRMRCGPVPGDLQLYDACKILVSTIGSGDDGGINWGQIWVYYEIVLISPQVEPKLRVANNIALYNSAVQQSYQSAVPSAVQWSYLDKRSGLLIVPNYIADTLTPPCALLRFSGAINMFTASSFTHNGLIQLQKNGAAIADINDVEIATAYSSATSVTAQASFDWLVDCSGTDTFQIVVTVTGTTVVGVHSEGTFLVVQVV